jgi:protein-S-isoprenylcysteine O-methyltransferase Ste14
MRIISIVGLLVMIVGIIGLLLRNAIFSTSLLGVGAQVAAVGLMIWARMTMGRRSFHATADPTDGGLVTSGPYRFIRHPIYTSVCLFCWAAVLAHATPSTVVLGSLVMVGSFMRMTAEERLLVQRYPGYRLYASATKRMVPYVF